MRNPADDAYAGLAAGGPGDRRRRQNGRRATDASKIPCPFCRRDESTVIRSRGLPESESVRRRRECANCHERFSTTERVDVDLLERELAARGNELRVQGLFDELPAPTWRNVDLLLHTLWGQAKEMEYIKTDWLALAHVLTELRGLRS